MFKVRYLLKLETIKTHFCISKCYYAKDIRFGYEMKTNMLQGIDILADAVSVTIGPKGRNVILEQPFGPPKITKNGVTIAKAIDLKNKLQNIGAKLIQSVASKTNEDAGDGTSTATILARAIAKEGVENISQGANPTEIRNGIILAVNAVTEHLQKISLPIITTDEIEQIATIAANGERPIGKLIASALNSIGKDGVVIVKNGRALDDQMEIVEGLRIERGYVSPYFINSCKGSKVEYSNSLVLFSEKKIFYINQIIPALELAKIHKLPLIIVAEDYEEEVLSLLILNKIKEGLQVVAIKAPGFGEYRKNTFEDLAVMTGGIVFEDNTNLIRLEDCQLESFGRVGETIISKDSTLFLKYNPNEIELKQRIDEIHSKLPKQSSDFERKNLMLRLSRLKSQVAIIYIGGSSEIEMGEKKDRVNDALNATRAAIQDGIVPGGGTALIRCIPVLSKLKSVNHDQAIGINIVKKALRTPSKAIIDNAGYNGKIIVSNIENMIGDYGYDVINNKYINMVEKGIIDPTNTIKKALTNASGIAALFTTSEAVICNIAPNVKKF